MATLAFFGKDLDPRVVSRILSTEPEISAQGGEKLFKRLLNSSVTARTGTWFLTTEHLPFHNPAAHLNKLVALVSPHLKQLRDLIPHLRINLSLLIFDPDSKLSDLPNDLLSQSVYIGDLEIEIPGRGEEVLISLANLHEYVTL